MVSKELDFPIVYKKNVIAGYGGNQEWYHKNWQQKAGCGSISGANLAAYYAANYKQAANIYEGDVLHFNYTEYLHNMTEMYQYMKPGLLGFPSVKKFGKQFQKFCNDKNVKIEASILFKFKSVNDAFDYVKENIDAGRPIALIILTHQAKELSENTWHWVTITGYTEDNVNDANSHIIISNYGRREKINKNLLFQVHRKNKLRMISFFL